MRFGSVRRAVGVETQQIRNPRSRENAAARLLDAHSDPVAVHRLKCEGFQNEHVQRALDQIGAILGHPFAPLEAQEEDILLLNVRGEK